MRLLICAGGTGGGVYPALAVLQALESDVNHGSVLSVLWIGITGGMEAVLVKRAGISYEAIPAAGVHGIGLRSLPGNILRLGQGYRQAGAILHRYQPDVLFFTGGYVAVPMALAGNHLPSMLYVPDIEPGLALKVLAVFADRIALTTDDSKKFLRRRSGIVVTGYPTRPGLKSWDRSKALEVFNLEENIPILLVFGGSSGARSINRALLSILPELIEEMQVIHVSGQLDWEEVAAARDYLSGRADVPTALLRRYQVFPYLHDEMGAAFTAADLVVSRAGASTLGEFPLFGLPAVLVPYPFAWRYQQLNAEYLARRGAAVVIPDKDLSIKLLPMVRELMRDRSKREQMRQAMVALAHPDAASSIARMLVELAGQGYRRGKKQ